MTKPKTDLIKKLINPLNKEAPEVPKNNPKIHSSKPQTGTEKLFKKM